ncbi:helicase [Microbacterium hominis]|uniref:Helicase n=1 Tax=Microbacterium hominis TaxID=162426 RepID=A0A7D4Q0A1_9MICO|nr:helicase [Microbacterium hominis]QKJ18778.1 helicase [Microbacterium hominis]
MAGSSLSLGVVAATVALALAAMTAGSAALTARRVAGAADAAALAAADAASGAVGGVPCERAAELATLGGAALTACELDVLIATVSVTASFAGLPVTARARAGPPP